MKYKNIQKCHFSHKIIAQKFGFANKRSFETSSAHKRYMEGLDYFLGEVLNRQIDAKKT